MLQMQQPCPAALAAPLLMPEQNNIRFRMAGCKATWRVT